MTKQDKLVKLYTEIAKITKQKCVENQCNTFVCCKKEQCESVIKFAKENHNVVLNRTNHAKLPLMGSNGCTAEPWLRPVCSLHICEKLLWKDQPFMRKYCQLRDKINRFRSENK